MLLCKLGPTAPCQMTLRGGKTLNFLGYVQECTRETTKTPREVLALFVSLNEQGVCALFVVVVIVEVDVVMFLFKCVNCL